MPALGHVQIDDEADESDDDIRIMDWERFGKSIATEYAPDYQRAAEIPHKLQDRMNSLSDSAKRANGMAISVFESMISENTPDEPSAPPIQIINTVDDELTPAFEFHYSNKMWHGEGVPPPDFNQLRGCQCEGPCDPHTCACVARSARLFEKVVDAHTRRNPPEEHIRQQDIPILPVYDKNRRLKSTAHSWPIHECNRLCKCTDECKNRVRIHCDRRRGVSH